MTIQSDFGRELVASAREYDTLRHLLENNLHIHQRPQSAGMLQLIEQYKKSREQLTRRGIKLKDSHIDALVKKAEPKILIKNISCKDSEGNEFEHYDELYVNKDTTPGIFGFDDSIAYLEKEGSFLPSLPLGNNILVWLFENRDDPEINKILMQYQSNESNYTWYLHNTKVDSFGGTFVNYPKSYQQGFHRAFRFRTLKPSENMKLEVAIQKHKKDVINLTGLPNPEVLIDIGKYLNKPATSLCTGSNRAPGHWDLVGWLGCNYNQFNIGINGNHQGNYSIRGASVK